MLDAEARVLLDLMEKAVQDGRPKLQTLPYAEGRAGGRQDVGGQRSRSARGRRDRSTAPSPGPAAQIRFRRYRPLGADGRAVADPDLLSRRRLRDRQHRDARFDLPAAGQQEPLPGDLDRLSPGARASLPRADRRRLAAFRHIRDNAAAFGVDASAHRRRRRFGGRRHRRRGLPGAASRAARRCPPSRC